MSFAELLHTGGIGTWSQIPAPEIVDMIGAAGFDFAVIDAEHAPFGPREVERQARACDAARIAPVLRLPRADPALVGPALDSGVSHVVLPETDDAGTLAACVAATRFAPRGTRGACPCTRSGGNDVRDWPAYEAAEEVRTGVVPLLETRAGLDALDAMLEVQDVAAWMLGPFDLSVSMGHRGDWRHAEVAEALDRAATRILDTGLPLIVPVFAEDPDECAGMVRDWRGRGAAIFLIGTDKLILSRGLRTAAETGVCARAG